MPYYAKAFTLDENGTVLPNGKKGRLAILDPLGNSYPSFILTGDDAIIEERCECGRSGQIISDISRTKASDNKGCGGAMTKLIGTR